MRQDPQSATSPANRQHTLAGPVSVSGLEVMVSEQQAGDVAHELLKGRARTPAGRVHQAHFTVGQAIAPVSVDRR